MADADVQAIVDVLADKEDSNLLEALKLALEERPAVVQELVDWAVPGKAYVNARLMMEDRQVGKIKSLSEANGYGFIDCPEVKEAFGNDVFLHGTQVAGFNKGDEVSFAILLNKDRKPQAFDLGPAQNGEDLRKKQYNDAKFAASYEKGEKGKSKGGAKGEKGDKGGATPRGSVAAAAPAYQPAKGAAKGAWPVEDWSAGGVWVPVGKGMDPYYGAYDPYYDPYYGGAYPVKGAYDTGKGKEKGKGEKGAKGGKAKDSAGGEEVPGITDRRWEGTVKSFNEKTGFGFIECPKIKEKYRSDVFLHHAQHIGSQPGEEVTFGIFLNRDGKPQAQDVQQKRGVKRIRAN